MTPAENSVIAAWLTDPKKKRKLRIEAAKRGMTLSKYAGLLIEKATHNFTDFDVGVKQIDDRAKHDSGKTPD